MMCFCHSEAVPLAFFVVGIAEPILSCMPQSDMRQAGNRSSFDLLSACWTVFVVATLLTASFLSLFFVSARPLVSFSLSSAERRLRPPRPF